MLREVIRVRQCQEFSKPVKRLVAGELFMNLSGYAGLRQVGTAALSEVDLLTDQNCLLPCSLPYLNLLKPALSYRLEDFFTLKKYLYV
jgi:hypothetical protein